MSFMEATHMGIKGVVKDDNGAPIHLAVVTVDGINHNVTTTEQGEYWRLLTPGTYRVTVSAPGHTSDTHDNVVVTNSADQAAVHDFTLTKRDAVEGGMQDSVSISSQDSPKTQTLSPEGFLSTPEFNYHHYDDLQVNTIVCYIED